MKARASLSHGTLIGKLHSEAWREPWLEIAENGAESSVWIQETESGTVVVKHGILRGKARIRHGLRRTFGLSLPRLREFDNLRWLRERLFSAPSPRFAGVILQGGLPTVQFLATERIAPSKNLADFLATEREDSRAAESFPERREVLSILAREVARMHALGFVHRDLYPRNLLVHERRIAFLDAWRGGPGFDSRGPAYDLACLMLYGADWLEREEQERFLAEYFEARASQDRPEANPESFLTRVARERTRLRTRLVRRPAERRDRELPCDEWSPPVVRRSPISGNEIGGTP